MSHLVDLLSAHLDGQLSAPEEARVAEHLAGCAVCSEELEDVRSARHMLRALPQLTAPVPLMPHARRPRWITAAASVAAGLLAFGLAVGPGEPEQTFDLDTLAGQHTTRVGVDPGIATFRAPVSVP